MRLAKVTAIFALFFAAAGPARGEYVALRNGMRLHVTGYQLLGDKYRLQVGAGFVMVPMDEVVAIEPEDQFAPLPPASPGAAVPAVKGPFQDIIESAAKKYGLDAELVSSVIAAESNFDAKAISPRNARGLMQLLPETAVRLGVRDIFDPQENVDAGTRYLSDLLKQYNNDLALALAAYNAGPERVQQFGSVPPYAETQSYVRRVKRGYEKNKSGSTGKSAADKSPAEKAPANKDSSSPSGVAQNKPTGSKQSPQ